ncbi:MAG TPA: hypothetical protein VNF68_00660, partial [Candidatus Baltobacteraceae bacterium]|nr:hypothetical protein [Candidatus Baltobacteraceae bacterium]
MLKLHWLVWVLAIVAAALAANPTAASTPQPAPSPVAPAYLLPQYATTFESLIVNGKIIPIKGFYLASPTPKPTPSPGATPTPQSQAPPQTPSETPASAVGFNCGVDQSEPDAFNVWVGPKPCADFWTDEAGPYVRAKQFFAALGAKIVSTSDPSTQKAMFEYNRHDLMGGVFVANSPALQKIGAGQYFWPGPYHGASPANIDLFGEGLITVSYCKHTFTGPYRMNKDQTVLGKANVDPYAWALAMNYSVTYHPVMNLWSVGYLGAFPDTGLNGTDSPLYTITPSDGTY